MTYEIATLLRLCQFGRHSMGISVVSRNCYWHKYCTLLDKQEVVADLLAEVEERSWRSTEGISFYSTKPVAHNEVEGGYKQDPLKF